MLYITKNAGEIKLTAQYKIEYSDILYSSLDDKRHAMVELIKCMKKMIDDGDMEQFVTIKRREGFDGKWDIVYKGSYE